MLTVNMHEAKTNLSSLVASVEKNHETIVLCRKGKPVAEIIPFKKKELKFPLKPHPVLGCIEIKCDLTAPLSEEEWPEENR